MLRSSLNEAQVGWSQCAQSTGSQSKLTEAQAESDSSMTVTGCARFCAGFQYFGLVFGRECRCGDSGYDSHGDVVPESQCATPCSGGGGGACGGQWRLTVYKSSRLDVIASAHAEVGCFTDAYETPVMGAASLRSTTAMTVERCSRWCLGRRSFGVEVEPV